MDPASPASRNPIPDRWHASPSEVSEADEWLLSNARRLASSAVRHLVCAQRCVIKRTYVVQAWLLALLFCTGMSGCRDRYVCGGPSDADAARANVCDREGEACLCRVQRCAFRDQGCDSGFRYSFREKGEPPGECARRQDVEDPIVKAPVEGTAAFCPGVGPRAWPCGVDGGNPCLDGEVCICATNRCATEDMVECSPVSGTSGGSSEESGDSGETEDKAVGLRYVDTNECVSESEMASALRPPPTPADPDKPVLCDGTTTTTTSSSTSSTSSSTGTSESSSTGSTATETTMGTTVTTSSDTSSTSSSGGPTTGSSSSSGSSGSGG